MILTCRKAPEDDLDPSQLEEKLIRLMKPRRQYLTARNTRIRIGKESNRDPSLRCRYQAEIPEMPQNKQL